MTLHTVTPTLKSLFLSEKMAYPVYLKMDCYQPAGSFKIRGLGKLCEEYKRQGKTHIVSPSGGNAGYAASYAARKLGMTCTVFAPKTIRKIFLDHIRAEGSEVVIKGNVLDEAQHLAAAYAQEIGAGFVSPFDHPTIWEGHATIIDECAAEIPKPGAILVAVGGGGLACGLLEGLYRNAWDDVPLIGVETDGTASFAACVAAQKHVAIDKITGVATSLGLLKVSKQLFDWSQKHPVSSLVVSDAAAIRACHFLAREQRAMVEPGCGAALAPLYDADPAVKGLSSVLVIVCGGIGTDVISPMGY